MASKLELRFKSPGVAGEQFTVKTGVTYTFENQRQGYRQVGIFDPYTNTQTHFAVASNFKDAYNQDDNNLGQSTVTMQEVSTDATGTALPSGTTHWLVIIENFDNDFFTGHGTGTTFMDATLTTTTQEVEPTLTVTIGQAADPCGYYKLTLDSNVVGGKFIIRRSGLPDGNNTEIATDGTVKTVELERPAETVEGVVELYEDGATWPVHSYLFNMPGVLSITSIEVQGSPFGASVTINTNSGIKRYYSLDNVNFQGSNQFTGLLAGNYTAYVKDDYGCLKSQTFTITEEQVKGMTAPPFIRVPIHNSLRFADRTGNTFVNYLSTENPGFVPLRQYFQDYLVNDVVRTQYKSSYANHRILLIDETGNESELPVIKKSDNINRTNIYEGNYKDKDGRLAIYFTSGNIYNKDGTVKEGHLLNGRLPIWYENGMFLDIEGIGVTQIDTIKLEGSTTYAITKHPASGTVLSKKITSIHTEHPYEVYEFDVNFQNTGKYQLRLEYWNTEKSFFLTELIKVHSELDPEYLEVQWWNKKNNDIIYNTGIKHFRRLKWENYFTLMPKTEKETYDTDSTVELINSKSFAVYKLSFESMPMEVARGLQVAFDNSSTIVINGVKFVSETPVKLEPGGQWYDFDAELTLVDQTMNGQQEIVDVINAEFLNVGTDDDVSFLRLN